MESFLQLIVIKIRSYAGLVWSFGEEEESIPLKFCDVKKGRYIVWQKF